MAHLTTFYKSQQLKCHYILSSERDINTLKLAIICQIMKENAWIFIKKKIVKVWSLFQRVYQSIPIDK